MANPTLNTGNKKIVWGRITLEYGKNSSTMLKLSGKNPGGEHILQRVMEKGQAGDSFYVQNFRRFFDQPTPFEATLEDDLGTTTKDAIQGYRYSMAAGIPLNKKPTWQSDDDHLKQHTKELGNLFGLWYDLSAFTYAGLYTPSTVHTRTTASSLWQDIYPSHATNMTAFALVANLASIGTGDAASSKKYNVFFAGLDADENPMFMPPVNSWDDMDATPERHLVTPSSIRALRIYGEYKGVEPVEVEFNGRTIQSPILVVPKSALYDIAENPEWRGALESGSATAQEMWDGRPFNAAMVGGTLILENYHGGYGSNITNSTALRSENITGNSKYAKYESILLGKNSLGTADWDEFKIVENDRHDFGRKTEVGFDVCTGFGAPERDDASGIKVRNTVSFIHTSRRIA